MRFRAPEKQPSSGERWIIFFFAFLMMGLFAADVAMDFSPAKCSVLFFVLAWVPLLILHEAGHAFMARALDWQVPRVVIGFGRTWWTFSVGRGQVQVRTVPLEGFTRVVPPEAGATRWASFMIFAAGPLSELLVLVGLLLWYRPQGLLTQSHELGVIAAQSVAAAAALGLLFNLIPHSIDSESGPSPNDGMGMLMSIMAGRKSPPESDGDPD